MSQDSVSNLAYKILKGFERYYRLFSRITAEAPYLFGQARWRDLQNNAKKRLDNYDQIIAELVSEVYFDFSKEYKDIDFWRLVKEEFTILIKQHPQFELAETFYNSVYSKVFKHAVISDEGMFVYPSQSHQTGRFLHQVVTHYEVTGKISSTIDKIFNDYPFTAPTGNRQRDLHNVARALKKHMGLKKLMSISSVDMLKPVFYRNKAAYIVGRTNSPKGRTPFVLAILNEGGKLYMDTILLERKDLSSLFGFARSYFFADSQHPAEIVAFLKELMPNKKVFELYSAIGFHKHSKTDFYRNFLNHINKSDDLFEAAPGIKGLVMTVFHLPSYGVVFKVIKDKFAPSKPITREYVKNRYQLVKTHDRVGRMADTHEFSNFRFPLHRFSQKLIDELKETTPSSIQIQDDELIIKHLYIERKLQPLNLYLAEHADNDERLEAVMEEYGNAIKEIAAANIFPGDMLLKNFGVSRRGRVIFYDYDEISYMTDCNFRVLPKTPNGDVDPALSVNKGDIFPEQFATFVLYNARYREFFNRYHSDLLDAYYWQRLQQDIANGQIKDVFPYSRKKRFKQI